MLSLVALGGHLAERLNVRPPRIEHLAKVLERLTLRMCELVVNLLLVVELVIVIVGAPGVARVVAACADAARSRGFARAPRVWAEVFLAARSARLLRCCVCTPLACVCTGYIRCDVWGRPLRFRR